MAQTEVFRESFIDIFYDPETGILHADWKGYQSVHSVQEGCERILELLIKYNSHMVLNDNTQVVGIWRFAAEWVATDWFPRMKQAGLKFFAWVHSPAKLAQLSTDTTVTLIEPDEFGVMVFHDKAEAVDWLQQLASDVKIPRGSRPRVLLVEDNRDFSQLFGSMLEIMGCDTAVAGTGRSGLDTAKRTLPDMIFCDLGLPGDMDGFDFARAVRDNKKMAHIPLIAVSGHTSAEDKERAVSAGFDRVFPKPVKFADVSGALAAFSKR